jgi:hypothetical protein
MLRAAANRQATTTDPNFNQVSLLLHGDGTNGSQNNTFIDSSTNNFTITRVSTATQGTYTPFSQAAGYWSNYFNGSSNGTSLPANANYDPGTTDYTIECWVYFNSITAGVYQNICNNRNSANTIGIGFRYNTSNVIEFAAYGGSATPVISVTSVTTPVANTWYHVAVSKSGSVYSFYLNGVLASSGTQTGTPTNGTTLTIAYDANNASRILNGYISNLRIVKGTAVYTSNFTPSTIPLTAITNTSLLTCQSNYFKDNSSNNATTTVVGVAQVQPWSPFAPTSAYSTSVNGGSVFFNGTTDYLTVPNNAALQFGSGNFTIEFWFYTRSFSIAQEFFNTDSSGSANFSYAAIISTTGVIQYYFSSTGNTWNIASGVSSGTIQINTWNHVAFVRNGTTITPYVNGIAGTTTTTAATLYAFTSALGVGNVTYNTANPFNGYISNFRIVKGTAVYTANFTPPTAPLTAITNTALLLNGTNAGIYDNAGKSDLITGTNPKVSTTQVKFGTGSIVYAASSNGITVPSQPYTTLGTANFTIEFWLYLNSTANGDFYDQRSTGTQAAPVLQLGSSAMTYYVSNVTQITGSALSTGQWYHIALTRSGTNTRLFVNGTQQGSTWTTDSTNYVSNNLGIGCYLPTPTNSSNCYLDDIRITNGIARYTANFTPPTSAFPNQ